jgi:hypothetical protein
VGVDPTVADGLTLDDGLRNRGDLIFVAAHFLGLIGVDRSGAARRERGGEQEGEESEATNGRSKHGTSCTHNVGVCADT